MTTDELREATKELDREDVAGSAKPLSAAMRSRWTEAKAKLPAGTALERLEIQIDECLEMAGSLQRDGLESIIHLLRSARNLVVLKVGHQHHATTATVATRT